MNFYDSSLYANRKVLHKACHLDKSYPPRFKIGVSAHEAVCSSKVSVKFQGVSDRMLHTEEIQLHLKQCKQPMGMCPICNAILHACICMYKPCPLTT